MNFWLNEKQNESEVVRRDHFSFISTKWSRYLVKTSFCNLVIITWIKIADSNNSENKVCYLEIFIWKLAVLLYKDVISVCVSVSCCFSSILRCFQQVYFIISVRFWSGLYKRRHGNSFTLHSQHFQSNYLWNWWFFISRLSAGGLAFSLWIL